MSHVPEQDIYEPRNGMQHSLPTAQAQVFQILVAVEHPSVARGGQVKAERIDDTQHPRRPSREPNEALT